MADKPQKTLSLTLYPKGVTIVLKEIIATGYLPFMAILGFFCFLFYYTPDDDKKEVLYSCGDSMKEHPILPWVLCIIIILVSVLVYRNGNKKKDMEIKRLQEELQATKQLFLSLTKK
jgi:hypothetical protein